jgi:hypothetical protein
LYISNNGPCRACDEAEREIARWRKEGRLRQDVEIKPVPSNPAFENFVRVRTGGRWGWPLLYDKESQDLVLGFRKERYENLLCV